MSTSERFMGIDISKTQLDLAVHGTGAPWQVAYDSAGLTQVVTQLLTWAPALIVLEATGGVEPRVASAWAAAQMPVVVVIHAKFGPLPKPQGPWRKLIGWMRRCWPTLLP